MYFMFYFSGNITNTNCGKGVSCEDICYKTNDTNTSIIGRNEKENIIPIEESPTCAAIYVGEDNKTKEEAFVKNLFNLIIGDFAMRDDYCFHTDFYPRDKMNFPS